MHTSKVTTRSESLKGTFTHGLKEAAADTRDAVGISLNRTTYDKVAELQEVNGGLGNNLEDIESPEEESTDVPEVTQAGDESGRSKGSLTPLYPVQETRPGRTWQECGAAEESGFSCPHVLV